MGRQEVLQLMVSNSSHVIAVSSGSQLSEAASLEDAGEVSLSSIPQQASGMGTFSPWKLTVVLVFSLGSETIGTLRTLLVNKLCMRLSSSSLGAFYQLAMFLLPFSLLSSSS